MDNDGGKAEMKQIHGKNNGADAFKGRRTGLLKKANELSILCGCKVGVIIFSSTGELVQYSSVSMAEIISKYHTSVEGQGKGMAAESPSTSGHLEIEELNLSNEKQINFVSLVEILKEEVKKIKSKQSPLCKEDEDYMQKLLEMIKHLLVVIQERKEELQRQKQQQSTKSEASNEQVRNLLDLLSPTSSPSMPFYVELDLMQRQNSSSINGSDKFYNFEADEGYSDTTLQLGLPNHVDRKRKEPEKETEFQPFP